MPGTPSARKGLPQGYHAHVLMSGGARVIESLLPGTMDRLAAAGAHRIGMPAGYVILLPQGWLRRWTTSEYVITCSRALLDWTIRDQVLEQPRVRLCQDTDVTGLAGDSKRVVGVQIRNRHSGADSFLTADLVIDATGRGSRARSWLTSLGLPAAREDTVDSGLVYVTRVYRAPGKAGEGFPVVNIQADPGQDRPGQTAALVPIENGQWLVTLSGTRGGEPPTDERRFTEFARTIRHPVVGDLIASAEPLGPVHVTRSTINRRRYFEKLPIWPDGFVVLGDAVAAYNPVYGHGMSVAALSASVMAAGLGDTGLEPGTARSIQRAVARTVTAAWTQACGQDMRFPGTAGPKPGILEHLMWRYTGRLARTATGRASIMEALAEVVTLSAPMRRLAAPHVVLGTLLGPSMQPLNDPPLTEAELASLTADR